MAGNYQELFPKGIYVLSIISQALGVSQQKKTPYVKFRCKVLRIKKGGDGKEINFNGSVFVDMWFSEKTKEKTVEFLKAAGFKGSSLRQLDPSSPQFIDLAGFEFDATCEHETYEGKTRHKFSALPVGSKSSNAWMEKMSRPDDLAIMNLDALFASALTKPTPQQKPATQSTAGSNEAPW